MHTFIGKQKKKTKNDTIETLLNTMVCIIIGLGFSAIS